MRLCCISEGCYSCCVSGAGLYKVIIQTLTNATLTPIALNIVDIICSISYHRINRIDLIALIAVTQNRLKKTKIIRVQGKIVPQSIKIYRYPFGIEEEEIFTKLNKVKIDLKKKKLTKRQADNLESLEINSKESNYGISGHVRLWIRRKNNRYSDETHLEAADVSFTISRTNKLLIIHGSPERDTIVKMISVILHNVEQGYFLPFTIPKEKMIKLQETILGFNEKNCVQDPRFDTTTRRYKDRSRQGFERSPTECATEDPEYKKILASCDNTYPIIRLVQCRGLLDYESDDFKPLELNERGEMRFYQNISHEAWDDFFFNVCQPILGVQMMN